MSGEVSAVPTGPNLRSRSDTLVARLDTVIDGLRVIVARVHGIPPPPPPSQAVSLPPSAVGTVAEVRPLTSSISFAHDRLSMIEKLIDEIKGDL